MTHPVWDRFLGEALPDDGARDYAQRYAGYALTGVTREEVFVFLRGPAGGGKSTFTEALARTWGEYAVATPFAMFLAKKPADGPREYLARLAGARLVTSVETRDGQRLAEGPLKELTGGDTITADRKHEHAFQFVPQCKLLLASNFRPGANAADDGLWRRLRELPFPTARPRREDQDHSIKAALTDPAQAGPAILAWAVAGCARWLDQGLGEPAAVREATADYRRSQAPLTDFVEECCRLGAGFGVQAGELRAAYERHCAENGVKHPLAARAWGEALRALGCERVVYRTSQGVRRMWGGIALQRDGSDSGEREPGDESAS